MINSIYYAYKNIIRSWSVINFNNYLALFLRSFDKCRISSFVSMTLKKKDRREKEESRKSYSWCRQVFFHFSVAVRSILTWSLSSLFLYRGSLLSEIFVELCTGIILYLFSISSYLLSHIHVFANNCSNC